MTAAALATKKSAAGRIAAWAASVWIPILLLAAYAFISRDWDWPNPDRFWLPPADEVWAALREQWFPGGELFASDLLPSVRLVLTALAAAFVAGTAAGLAVGSSPRLAAATRPLFDFLRAVPMVLLISPGLLLFGVGDSMVVFVLIAGVLWPILINAVDGARGVSTTLDDFARAYRLSRRDRFLRILLPAASPNIFAGLRLASTRAVVLLVIAQAFGTGGLGFHLRNFNSFFLYAEMFSTVVVFGLLGYGLNLLLTFIERRTIGWFFAVGGGY